MGRKVGYQVAIVTKIQGPVTYLLEMEDKRVVYQHVDHVKLRISLVEPVDKKNDDVEEPLPLVMSEVSETQAELNTDTTQWPVRTYKHPSRLIEEID